MRPSGASAAPVVARKSPAAARRLPVAPVVLVLLLALFASVVGAIGRGDTPLPPSSVARALGHRLLPHAIPGAPDQRSPLDPTAPVSGSGARIDAIIWELRVPRVFLAALVGAALSMAGLALQGLLGNPLADPYVIGVSSGAAVGAGIAILAGIANAWGGFGLPLCGFGAALVTMALVFALARAGGRLHAAGFLLAGVVAGSFLWSIMTLLLTLAGVEQRKILNWLMGRFSDATLAGDALIAPFVFAGFGLLLAAGRGLDAFSFGEDTARSVGVEVERFKVGILALCALLTAVAVSLSGIIGFVGLIVPHAARALVGPPHRAALPVAALLGAILTVLADLLARTIRPGEELPVGVVTAIIGAPFFFVLLRRQMGR